MRIEQRLALALCALALGFASPAWSDDSCASAGAFPSLALGGDESGIGGTGHSDPESGIGGTGRGGDESGIGGTGIYGTVTAVGSVCVNGLRVHHARDVPVEVNGQRASAEALAVGLVVFVLAQAQGDRLETDHIAVWSAVVGAVDALDHEQGELVVEGRRVRVERATLFAGGLRAPEIALGDRLNVSGLPDADGVIVASRIAPVVDEARLVHPPSPGDLVERSGARRVSIESYLAGSLERLDLAGLRLDLPERPDTARDVRPGLRVRAFGRMLRPGVLRVDRPERPSRSRIRPSERPRTKPARDRDVRPQVDRPERVPRPESVDRPERPAVLDDIQDVQRR